LVPSSHTILPLALIIDESSFFQDDGRRSFWSVNGPRILQVGYEDEEDPKVMEAYELIGSLLVGKGEGEQELGGEKPQ